MELMVACVGGEAYGSKTAPQGFGSGSGGDADYAGAGRRDEQGQPATAVLSSLSIGGNARLDLGDNDLIVRNSDITAVTNAIKSGRLISARVNQYTILAAILNDVGDKNHTPSTSSFAGQSVLATDVLVKYTWNGDANLDGVVNADDYFQIDAGFISQKAAFCNGDFNYDRAVNADDYFLIDSSFIGQSGPLSASKPKSAASEDTVVQPMARKAEPDGILSQLFSTEAVL